MNPVDLAPAKYPGYVPTSALVLPAPRHASNQIQQTKGSAKPQVTNVLPTTQPSKSGVQPRTTPTHVSHVRVMTRAAVNGQKQVVVQFNQPDGDPYFQGASVYLKRANGQPTQVASGSKSPLTFNAPVSAAPHSIHVTSFGPWGETDIIGSPSRPVRLRG